MREEQRARELEGLWEAYRQAMPEPEASVNFTPQLWARIEAEQWVSWVGPLRRLAARVLPLAAAVTLAMGIFVWNTNGSGGTLPPGYVEMLTADLIEEETHQESI